MIDKGYGMGMGGNRLIRQTPGMGALGGMAGMGAAFQQPNWQQIFGPSLDRYQQLAQESTQQAQQGPLSGILGGNRMGIDTTGGLGGMMGRAMNFWFGGGPSAQQRMNAAQQLQSNPGFTGGPVGGADMSKMRQPGSPEQNMAALQNMLGQFRGGGLGNFMRQPVKRLTR